jgi:hypothetical protein
MEKIRNEKISLYDSVETLRKENPSTKELVIAIGNFIISHAKSLPKQYEPKSIIESRFTSAEEAFEKGMLSCGAMANVSTAMLKHLGYKVKLIHGECEESVDHAWISVLDPEKDEWIQYDLTRPDGIVPPGNIVKEEVDSWDEIRDQIEDDHNTLKKRRINRGL